MSEQHDHKPTTRRELMRPAQLLGLAAVAAVFAGVVTAVSMGILQTPTKPGWTTEHIAEVRAEVVSAALSTAGIFAGITFIVVLLVLSLLLLAVKPSDFGGTVDTPVLTPEAQDAKHAAKQAGKHARSGDDPAEASTAS